MKIARPFALLPLLALAATSLAQTWSKSYDEGLTAARQGKWAQARDAFKKAATLRADDASAPTLLPGPPTERRRWRNGAAYSPNFLAAYSLYRQALTESGDTQSSDLRTAASEFEGLIQKGQSSRASYYFANLIYTRVGDTAKANDLQSRYAKNTGKLNWKVDTEIVAPEDLAAIEPSGTGAGGQATETGIAATSATGGGTKMITIRANDLQPGTGNLNMAALVPGRVPTVQNKYALIVGNSDSKIAGTAIPFAADDAQRIREGIIANAGYDEANVELATNATAAQILAKARALVARMPQDATVMIYFAGAGVNVGGKDYLAGVDAQLSSDTSAMVSKTELFQTFMAKGARIFSFFQANRPMDDGRFFGSELPMVGAIAQVQATLPGESVSPIMEGGKTTGVYTKAFVEVLQDLKSNSIPILEFGWQVFYKIRRGNTGQFGGGSRQTPTLPVLTNVASDARF